MQSYSLSSGGNPLSQKLLFTVDALHRFLTHFTTDQATHEECRRTRRTTQIDNSNPTSTTDSIAGPLPSRRCPLFPQLATATGAMVISV
jgi:hypothetical protein